MTAEERVEILYQRGWPAKEEVVSALRAHRTAALEEAAKVAENTMPFIVAFDPRDCCTCNKEIAAAIRACVRMGVG